MKKVFTLVSVLISVIAHSQQLLTWSPQFPTDASNISITMNSTQGNRGLYDYNGVTYMHLGVITNLSTSPSDWRYVTTVWGSGVSPLSPNGKTPTATLLGNNSNTWVFSISNPRTYFKVPAGETILEIALLYRTTTGDTIQRNADGGDMKIPIYTAGSSNIIFTTPSLLPENYPIQNTPINVGLNTVVPVTAIGTSNAGGSPNTNTGGVMNLYFNNTLIAGPTASGTTSISGSGTPTTYGNQQFVAENTVNNISYNDTINFYITPPTVIADPPAAVINNGIVHEGINYYGCSDSVTLVLYAPNKTSAVVIGDFAGSNWLPQAQYQMYKSINGNYYWITIHGLTSGTQYAFQYLVDNTFYIADPYSEVILDGANDKYIPAATYPNLKAYPTNSNVSTGKNGLIGILQTCPPQYTWKATNFTPPNKQNLIIEEVMIRDFATADGYGNFQLLLDSLHYFKSLGINAIEVMPVAEFSGNDSWGYNPNFYCALDKAYGTKTMYKTFVDSCHANGIAVIQDVVYNQVDDNNVQVPEARLYWNSDSSRPAVNNPWLNPVAPHPYGVFDDLNHTSTATQYWVERSLSYWLTEYHIDGFRFDLAKGFTQTQSNTTTIENYDASRVANLERYYDTVKNNHPTANMPYMILEFLSGNLPSSEEQEYVNHGFMVWNEIGSYSPGQDSATRTAWAQNMMGYPSNNAPISDLSAAIFNSSQKQFSTPAAVDYMASHDDERTMYLTELYGNGTAKSVSAQGGALQRQAAAAAILFEAPGPHMFYQFDERGNDTSQRADGSNTSYKNPLWWYLTTDVNAAARRACVAAYSNLINLRVSNPAVFDNVTTNATSINGINTNFNYDLYNGGVNSGDGGLFRLIQMSDPSGNGLSITTMANFSAAAQVYGMNFQAAGNWYNYQSNGTGSGLNGATGTTFSLSSTAQTVTLQPGEYHVWIYEPSTTYTFIGNGNWDTGSNWLAGSMPPATLPSGSQIIVEPQPGGQAILNIQQTVSAGATFTVMANKNLLIPLNLNVQQ